MNPKRLSIDILAAALMVATAYLDFPASVIPLAAWTALCLVINFAGRKSEPDLDKYTFPRKAGTK